MSNFLLLIWFCITAARGIQANHNNHQEHYFKQTTTNFNPFFNIDGQPRENNDPLSNGEPKDNNRLTPDIYGPPNTYNNPPSNINGPPNNKKPQQLIGNPIFPAEYPSNYDHYVLPPAPPLNPFYVRAGHQKTRSEYQNQPSVSYYSTITKVNENEVPKDDLKHHEVNRQSNHLFDDDDKEQWTIYFQRWLYSHPNIQQMPLAEQMKLFSNEIDNFGYDDAEKQRVMSVVDLAMKKVPENASIFIQINENSKSFNDNLHEDKNLHEIPVDSSYPKNATRSTDSQSANDIEQSKRLLTMILNLKNDANKKTFISNWIHTYLITYPGLYKEAQRDQISFLKTYMTALSIDIAEQNQVLEAFASGLRSKIDCDIENDDGSVKPLRLIGHKNIHKPREMVSYGSAHNTKIERDTANSLKPIFEEGKAHSMFNFHESILPKLYEATNPINHNHGDSLKPNPNEDYQSNLYHNQYDAKSSGNSKSSNVWNFDTSDLDGNGKYTNVSHGYGFHLPSEKYTLPNTEDYELNNSNNDSVTAQEQIFRIINRSLNFLMLLVSNRDLGHGKKFMRKEDQDFTVENGCVCVNK